MAGTNKTDHKRTPRCTCTNLLYLVAIIGAVVAGTFYYIVFVCDLTNEHKEMDCPSIFALSTLPKVFKTGIGIISLLANLGLVDLKQSACSYLSYWDLNTTQLFNFPQVPVTTQEWKIHGYNVYTYTPNELMGVSNQPAVIHLHGGSC